MDTYVAAGRVSGRVHLRLEDPRGRQAAAGQCLAVAMGYTARTQAGRVLAAVRYALSIAVLHWALAPMIGDLLGA